MLRRYVEFFFILHNEHKIKKTNEEEVNANFLKPF